MTDPIKDFAELVAVTARLQDTLADLDPRTDEVAACTRLLDEVVTRLEALPVVGPGEDPVALAHSDPRVSVRPRGLVPEFTVATESTERITGTTVIRPHFGGLEAAHGGALALFFDDILGRLANQEHAAMSRTAYLHVEFKKTVPVGVVLDYDARVTRAEGRKIVLEAALLLDDQVLTTGEGLWVQLREEDRPKAFDQARGAES